MDPMHTLYNDHQKFLTLFSQIEKTHADTPELRRELYLRFELIFTVHTLVEEHVFYKELLSIIAIAEIIKKSYESHHLVDIAMRELKATPYSSENWLPKFQAIRDTILSHVAEEENFLFPQLRESLTQQQLLAIAEKMTAYRQNLIHSNNNNALE